MRISSNKEHSSCKVSARTVTDQSVPGELGQVAGTANVQMLAHFSGPLQCVVYTKSQNQCFFLQLLDLKQRSKDTDNVSIVVTCMLRTNIKLQNSQLSIFSSNKYWKKCGT